MSKIIQSTPAKTSAARAMATISRPLTASRAGIGSPICRLAAVDPRALHASELDKGDDDTPLAELRPGHGSLMVRDAAAEESGVMIDNRLLDHWQRERTAREQV